MDRQQRNEKVLALWPAIQAKASYLATRYDLPEPAEIANDLALSILERAEQEPALLLAHPAAYILQQATWRWQDAQRHARMEYRFARLDAPICISCADDIDDTLADLIPDPAPPAGPDPDLRTAFARLPEPARRLLARVYVRGDTQRQIAAEMGRPESTVRRWATEARQLLAAEMGAA